ncbi:MAG: hypothetical protein M0C28_32495 [Candidatus Moduliflexus flocculans]|nr:hypothetical protein [Candidatus Moduliflexus flocculans]
MTTKPIIIAGLALALALTAFPGRPCRPGAPSSAGPSQALRGGPDLDRRVAGFPRGPRRPLARYERPRGRRPRPPRPHRREGLHPGPGDRDLDRAFGDLDRLGPEQDRRQARDRRHRRGPLP